MQDTCRRALGATEEQEHVIDALLVLARSQAGVQAREPVDLAELADAWAAGGRPAAAGIELAADLQPAPVRGDRRLLERLVANLLENAVGHNLPDRGWIRLETGCADGHSVLRITNPGALIAADQVPELFEPFRRLTGERTATGGLGLGLSIVRAIATAHGGQVIAVGRKEGGLEVGVHLPAAHPAAAHGAERARAVAG